MEEVKTQKVSLIKYFFSTFKQARWLLFKYLVVGVCLIFVGVIANRLNLNDLTYFNSMMTLCYFSDMLGFAFNEGFGIYVNQNFSHPEKSKSYAVLGFRFTFFAGVILSAIFMIFSDFIIKNLLRLDFEVDKTFYFLMTAGVLLNSLVSYCSDLLKKTELFKFQFINSVIQLSTIALGLLLLVFCGSLMLNLIGIVYLVSYLACLIYLILILAKNKNYGVNVLSFKRLKLSGSEFLVVLSRALSEVVWEVGYIFVALFLLKANNIVYNQYSYFENVLDIFNGLLFAFINVTAIRICRCIGTDDKEGGFYHAKQAIKSVCLIWVCYAVLALALSYPIIRGMNPELQSTGMMCLLLYLALSFLRFHSWNMGTYILGQSEYYAKMLLIFDIIFSLWNVTLYLIAGFFPSNIFVLFAVLSLEPIIASTLYSIIISRKKWLRKLSANEKSKDVNQNLIND